VHVHSYFALQVSSAHACSTCICVSRPTRPSIHQSIHHSLVSIGAFSCYFLLSDISPSVLHTLALSTAVGPLLHIFTVIFSLFGLRFRSCTLSST
jgi:hypothetical protein